MWGPTSCMCPDTSTATARPPQPATKEQRAGHRVHPASTSNKPARGANGLTRQPSTPSRRRHATERDKRARPGPGTTPGRAPPQAPTGEPKKKGAKWNRQLQQRTPPAPKTPATSSGKRRPSQLLPPAYTGSLHELQNGRHRDERRLRAKAAATPTPESAKRAASNSAACRQHERARRHHGAPKRRQ